MAFWWTGEVLDGGLVAGSLPAGVVLDVELLAGMLLVELLLAGMLWPGTLSGGISWNCLGLDGPISPWLCIALIISCLL